MPLDTLAALIFFEVKTNILRVVSHCLARVFLINDAAFRGILVRAFVLTGQRIYCEFVFEFFKQAEVFLLGLHELFILFAFAVFIFLLLLDCLFSLTLNFSSLRSLQLQHLSFEVFNLFFFVLLFDLL